MIFVAKNKLAVILCDQKTIIKIYLCIIMRKDFYIFRHGQTDFNSLGIWQGARIDVLLNEEGKKQAMALVKKICSLQLTNFYSSPLLRAVQTANILATQVRPWNPYPVTILHDLRECDFGACEGLSMDAAVRKYGNDFIQNFLSPTQKTWGCRFEQGESKDEVFTRVIKCLKRIFYSLTKDSNNRIGVVCHAGVISALQCGLDLQNVCYDNCSVLHLSYETETEKWTQIFD